jgi:pyruvate formate lyase activating enzyme
MHENAVQASFWQGSASGAARCGLCPHACVLPEGGVGLCRARRNVSGVLYAESYGEVSALALDPIEKKPLCRFKPGSLILSAGSRGCNFSCRFCQNWRISQAEPAVKFFRPEQLVDLALAKVKEGNIGLAYTYSEPAVWYEFVRDCALLAKEAGLDNVFVSNGYLNPGPLREIAPLLAAANIDLKSCADDFYRRMCGGRLAPVRESIKILAGFCHVEVTTLVIPGCNDSEDEIARIAAWLAEISPSIPLHVTRYYPNYRFSAPPAPKEKILRLKEVAEEFLSYVCAGNI